MAKKNIYLDYAATTPLDLKVERVILAQLKNFGNPSSIYSLGRQAKQVIEDARKSVAKILNSSSEELVFTGSGTESDNLAIFGIARA